MMQVLSEVSLNLAHFDRMQMREEWDSLREHDVVFLVSIQSPHVRQQRDALVPRFIELDNE